MKNNPILIVIIFTILAVVSCNAPKKNASQIQKEIQERLINAKPGDTISFDEGFYEFKSSLSLDGIENITIKGKGAGKTILSFKGQTEGAEGFMVKANGITFEDLTVQDTKGDGIKVQNSKGVTFRRVNVRWTEGAKASNGGYGLYPVTCKNVLVEECEISEASDAGIYIGQSENIVVRKCKAHDNVAGIEIENCKTADVYENLATNNTGGILVFDMPEIPVKNGQDVRVYNNEIKDNNHPNFAPEGNMVGRVPAGTGVLVLAYNFVEVFNNRISNHRSFNASIACFLTTGKEYKDSLYNPYSYGISIHDNDFSRQPMLPDTTRILGKILAQLFGLNPPDIVWDGMLDPAVIGKDGVVAPENRICIKNNKNAKFVNLSAQTAFKDMTFDEKLFDCERKPLPGAKLQ